MGHVLVRRARHAQGAAGEAPIAPGMLASRCARRPSRCGSMPPRRGPARRWLVCRGARLAGGDAAVAGLDLSPTGDLVEAAANLFAYLRALDAPGVHRHRGGADSA